MQISLNWLNQIVDIENVNLEHLLEKLTLGGFEIEELLELKIDEKKEIIIDISATANRADSLSIKGIAKEIISLMNLAQKETYYLTNNLDFKNKIEEFFSPISNFIDCSIFLAVSIENLVNFNSPYWLKKKLFSVGIEPTNNLLDYQNYIFVETGYPFEFYDLEKIKKKTKDRINLTLGFPHTNYEFIGENMVKYSLNKNILVLKNNKEVLSIAGIIANKEFSYNRTTNSLLIEGAVYNSQTIRKTSRLLNVRTDRSAKYEKGLTHYNFIESFYHLIFLLKILNPNLICNFLVGYQKSEKPNQSIQLKYENIMKILGAIKKNPIILTNQLEISQISDYLTQLKCQFVLNKKTLIWDVQVPNSRSDDIIREIDLIEEIGRFCGFNNFIPCLPKINQIGWKDFSYQTRNKITFCFLNEGFYELVNYSFVKEKNNNSIQLLNPLLSDYKTLRTSLLPNMLQTVSDINKQTNCMIEGFEFGHVFFKDKKFGYKEVEYVAGIFGGISMKATWSETSSLLSWFEAKGKIEEIFCKLNISIRWKSFSDNMYNQIIHPYRIAKLYRNNEQDIGIFGQIHPILAQQLNISSQLFLFEFNFESIKNELKKTQLSFFEEYSSYPKIFKDLSFLVDRNISFEEIKFNIMVQGAPYLIQVNLLDEYQGPLIPEFFTSLCVQLIFQSNKRTLVTKEIETIIENIESNLIKKFNVKIRV